MVGSVAVENALAECQRLLIRVVHSIEHSTIISKIVKESYPREQKLTVIDGEDYTTLGCLAKLIERVSVLETGGRIGQEVARTLVTFVALEVNLVGHYLRKSSCDS